MLWAPAVKWRSFAADPVDRYTQDAEQLPQDQKAAKTKLTHCKLFDFVQLGKQGCLAAVVPMPSVGNPFVFFPQQHCLCIKQGC